jgi:hypothetical protein
MTFTIDHIRRLICITYSCTHMRWIDNWFIYPTMQEINGLDVLYWSNLDYRHMCNGRGKIDQKPQKITEWSHSQMITIWITHTHTHMQLLVLSTSHDTSAVLYHTDCNQQLAGNLRSSHLCASICSFFASHAHAIAASVSNEIIGIIRVSTDKLAQIQVSNWCPCWLGNINDLTQTAVNLKHKEWHHYFGSHFWKMMHMRWIVNRFAYPPIMGISNSHRQHCGNRGYQWMHTGMNK